MTEQEDMRREGYKKNMLQYGSKEEPKRCCEVVLPLFGFSGLLKVSRSGLNLGRPNMAVTAVLIAAAMMLGQINAVFGRCYSPFTHVAIKCSKLAAQGR